MKYLVLFILVTTYFRLHEACENNRIELHNELGPGRILELHCHSLEDDLGVKNLNFNAPPFVIGFHDNVITRTAWYCMFRQGANKEYFYKIEAYRAGYNFIPRCGQLRVWTAKLDGIYFSKILGTPPVLALRWNKA
ncbi:unnamed protein product [Eruca vesicaria subsp. sativa]|uniref:S-protein homolog n=1 Tax=Eruca vesicaria subsp. sativa TaxID=29727 RepID=A0ABC8MAB3_ERUVS|nr:unnamed protein product [Eruca vesicaria subsp. sativa]